jgi:hypothetical protein
LAKKSPRLSSEMFCGRLDLFVSRRCTGSTYDEQVGRLASATSGTLRLTSASAKARAAGACSQAIQVSFFELMKNEYAPAKAVTEDPSTAGVSMRWMLDARAGHTLFAMLPSLSSRSCWLLDRRVNTPFPRRGLTHLLISCKKASMARLPLGLGPAEGGGEGAFGGPARSGCGNERSGYTTIWLKQRTLP